MIAAVALKGFNMASLSSSASPIAAAPPTRVRRRLCFESLADILADAEAMASQPVVTLGAWSAAQNIEHVRRLVRIAHAGTDVRVNVAFRVLGRSLRSRFLRSPFRPGLKTHKSFEPPAGITMDEAIVAFRAEIASASRPGAMSFPSPLLGRLTHEQWEQLHCRHAELHFGFVLPADAS
ncbi:MAG: DUF1569 domain-containing protein [Planctomycetota bacterium]